MKRAHNFKDKSGTRKGRLRILELDQERSGPKRLYYKCVCDCGTSISVHSSNLRENGKTVSCGCYRNERVREPRPEQAWKISPEERGLREVYHMYVKNAKIANRDFQLTKEEFRALIVSDCYYCGAPPSNYSRYVRTIRGKSYDRIAIYNGLDRKIQGEGYTVQNVVPCCKDCNYAKHVLDHDVFLTLVSRIYNKHFNKED